jgi:hypothetical protein
MDVQFTHRGRMLSAEDVAFVRALIAAHPEASRRALSKKLCQAWGWVQPNGQLRDMVCRSLMLELHRGGFIELPAVRCRPPNNVVARRKPPAPALDSKPSRTTLAAVSPVSIHAVRGTSQEALFGALIEAHHYLGYTPPVGEHLKYLVYAENRPIACLLWTSAVRHLGPRDRFIGWSPQARRRNLHLLAYNSRFLILPWVEVPHLASHLLGRIAKRLPGEWRRVYGHGVHYLETFVDPGRFRGTCYRAANWRCLGQTTGRGKADPHHRPNRPCKLVFGYPLEADFRQRLASLT